MYYDYDFDFDIEQANISSEDKKLLKEFLELLKSFDADRVDEISSYTNEQLSHIFQIAKFNPKMQIEMWQKLPDEIVNNSENIGIFEDVLDNKFGENVSGFDKKALVKLLNNSRSGSRSSRW